MEDYQIMNDFIDYLTTIIEANDSRYSFEFAVSGGTMEVYDKEQKRAFMLDITMQKGSDSNGK